MSGYFKDGNYYLCDWIHDDSASLLYITTTQTITYCRDVNGDR